MIHQIERRVSYEQLGRPHSCSIEYDVRIDAYSIRLANDTPESLLSLATRLEAELHTMCLDIQRSIEGLPPAS